MEHLLVKQINKQKDIIFKSSHTMNSLSSVFENIERKVEKNEKIDNDFLSLCIDNLKKYVSDHNNSIDEKYNDEYFVDKNLYLNNIKTWNNLQSDFNNEAIIFFY